LSWQWQRPLPFLTCWREKGIAEISSF
jgi:hypothetical protein